MYSVLTTTVRHGAVDVKTAKDVRRSNREPEYSPLNGCVEELHRDEMSPAYVHAHQKAVEKSSDGMAVDARKQNDRSEEMASNEEEENNGDDDQFNEGGYEFYLDAPKGMQCYRCGGYGHCARMGP